LGIEGFIEVLRVSTYCVFLDLGVEGFVKVLQGLLCCFCLDLGVEGFVETLGCSQAGDWLDDVASMPCSHHSQLGSMGKAKQVYEGKRQVSHIPGMTAIVYYIPIPPFIPLQPI